jgi:hypothetical protein
MTAISQKRRVYENKSDFHGFRADFAVWKKGILLPVLRPKSTKAMGKVYGVVQENGGGCVLHEAVQGRAADT